MIQATCRGCGQQLKVKDHLAGKQVKCPRCGDALRLPGAPDSVQHSAPVQPPPATRREPPLEAAFDFSQVTAALPITCPACAASFTPADDLRGKKAFCPGCGKSLIVSSGGVAKGNERPRPALADLKRALGWNPLWLLLAVPLLLLAGGLAGYLLGRSHTDEQKQVANNDHEARPVAKADAGEAANQQAKLSKLLPEEGRPAAPPKTVAPPDKGAEVKPPPDKGAEVKPPPDKGAKEPLTTSLPFSKPQTEVKPPPDKGTEVKPPPAIVPAQKSKLYVAQFGGSTLHVIDTASFKLLKIVEVGPNPSGLVATAAADRIFITIENVRGKQGELLWYDPVTDLVTKRMKVGPRPKQPACTPDGKCVYVPCGDGLCWVVDAEKAADNNIIAKLVTGGRPQNAVCSADGKFMYVGLGGARGPSNVLIYEMFTHKPVGKIPLSGAPRSLALSHDGKRLYASVDGLVGFEVADVPNRKVLYRVKAEVPAELRRTASRTEGIALRPDEKELWLCDALHDRVYVFDLTVSPPKQVAAIALKAGGPGMCFSPDGRFCCISERIGDGVEAVDTKSRQLLAKTYPGKTPTQVLVIPETK